jgi:hypothetical protein
MPPRFAYWTILIDNTPTAFRARDRDELLPTLTQLKRTNERVELKWFAQGRLWESPEAQRESWRKPKPAVERRDRDWRPGGAHKDPRARFDKAARRRTGREERTNWNAPKSSPPDRERERPSPHPRGDQPWKNRPPRPPSQRVDHKGGGWKSRPPRQGGWKNRPPGDRPWHNKPKGARPDRQPWRPRDARGDRRKRRDDEPDQN